MTLSGVSTEAASADVKSKRARSVRLRRQGDALGVACSCWPQAAEASPCKHLWAALLAVDKEGGLDALRTTPKPIDLVPLAPAPEPKPAPSKIATNAKKKKPAVKPAKKKAARARRG